jgi:D-3-phosphoglycerate dehydrogenase / 2-oxoglutarate reductase
MTGPDAAPEQATVLVTSRSFGTGTAPVERRLTDAGLEVIRASTVHDPDELRPLLSRATAWIAGTAPITEEHLAAAPGLRIIARYGVGVDSVDLDAATARNVPVTNTPGANSDAVADLTFALLLAGLRGVPAGDRSVREGSWRIRRGRELGALALGVVGLGRIGRGVIERARSFGCVLYGHDPYLTDEEIERLGVRPAALDELPRLADAVTLHAPGGRRLVDRSWLDRARPGLLLVNTARADLVDERAVADALRDGRLSGYAADTLASESDAPGTSGADRSPLLAADLADRLVLTPHLGAQTVEAVDRMGTSAVTAVLDRLAGRRPDHIVNDWTHQAPRADTPARRPGRPQGSSNGPTMAFVGVSTGQSSIRKVFPRWAEMLGLPAARLVGHDLPLGASPEAYRALIRRLRDDDTCAGGLVTSHKIGVYRAAADMFDVLDDFASQCGEISSVSKRNGKLIGHAKDPLTAGLALEEFLAPDHFTRTGAHVLVLGSGGAGTAITWYLSQRADRPERVICTSRGPRGADELRTVLRRSGLDTGHLATHVADGPADALLAGLPEGSVVINATGLGKDAPGSPVGDGATWPRRGTAWELNYRGSLEFLHQARDAARRDPLDVVDGWRYFVHGWTQVIAEVFGLDLTEDQVEELARAAEGVR